MKIPCPKCGHIIETAKAKQATMEALLVEYMQFGLEEKLVMEYIGLFASPAGFLSFPKEKRLLGGFRKIWDEEVLKFGGREWRTTRDEIKKALEYICNAQKPLKTHNYLLVVLQAKAVAIEKAAESKRHKEAFDKPRKPEAALTKAVTPKPKEDPAETQRIITEAKAKLKIPDRTPLTAEQLEDRRKKLAEQARQQGVNLEEV